MTRSPRRVLAAAVLAFGLGAAADAVGAERGPPPFAPRAAVAGRVTCAGGDTMAPLIEAWGRGLKARESGVEVRVDPAAKLAAEGFRKLLDGQADCVSFVREPFPSEIKAYRDRFGRDPVLIPVAGGSWATRGGTHAVAIYVNDANPLRRLSLDQVDRIFSEHPRHGGAPIVRWGQLGLTGAWRDRPIRTIGMLTARASGDPPGLVNFLQQRALRGGAFRADMTREVDRPGEQSLAAIVREVAADPRAIGFSGFDYAQPGARPLALAETGRGPWVEGSPASVASRAYPLSRRIYVLIAPGRPAPALRELLRYALSQEGQAAVATDPEGFLPLSRADAAAAARLLQ